MDRKKIVCIGFMYFYFFFLNVTFPNWNKHIFLMIPSLLIKHFVKYVLASFVNAMELDHLVNYHISGEIRT